MTLSVIQYNSSSGSDTLASGAGPATAVIGTKAAHTSGSSSTTIEFSNSPDLSGVAADDILWLNTSAGGRHLSRIISVNDGADTMVVEDAFNITAVGAVNYAIGGLRASLDADTTNTDMDDAKAGWAYELQAGTYTNGVTMTIIAGNTTDGPVELRAASGASPTLSWTGDFAAITISNPGYAQIVGITFSNVTSTNVLARCISMTASASLQAYDCSGSAEGAWLYTVQAKKISVKGCDISSGGYAGIEITNGRTATQITNNVIHDCGAQGVKQNSQLGLESFVFVGNVVRDSTTVGLWIKSTGAQINHYIKNNVFHGNTTDGIEMQSTIGAGAGPYFIVNNIFTSNGAYGLQGLGSSGYDLILHNDHNAFYNNTSGEVNGITKGGGSVTMTGDPYTDEAGDDYTLNATAGAGAAGKNAGLGYSG